MVKTTLDSPFVDEGVQRVSFWNGRILTAKDLRDEQLANQRARRRLGRAVGAGVAYGLTVRAASSTTQVTVRAGLAVNGEGQTLELPVDVDVSLVVPPSTARGNDVFVVCEDLP